jgi:hypothetical protein
VNPDVPKPYSIATLAERWSCSQRVSFGAWSSAGQLKVFKVGILTRISAQEVERLESAGQPSNGEKEPLRG